MDVIHDSPDGGSKDAGLRSSSNRTAVTCPLACAGSKPRASAATRNASPGPLDLPAAPVPVWAYSPRADMRRLARLSGPPLLTYSRRLQDPPPAKRSGKPCDSASDYDPRFRQTQRDAPIPPWRSDLPAQTASDEIAAHGMQTIRDASVSTARELGRR